MARLLLVRHSPTENTRALAEAVEAGARDDAIDGVDVQSSSPDGVDAAAVNAADGVIVLTPANFGYMAGLVKDLFDRTFLDIGGALADDGSGSDAAGASGRTPWALVVHGRYDTEGAVRSVESIVQALPWRRVAEPLEVLGDVTEADREAAYELGATVAAVISS
ncbi:NAD(P)H-dependent oxidoreductase [Aeromicrobium halocynthiae]|uniref:NAD(P)H-dependent oxidoreductase n=1 Tax=Aeromicrobium halocynthiae TaxID=560557 RepID=A0ABN2VYQ0_9ACTN